MQKNLPYDRAQRVSEEIFHIIASACYNSLSDPRLEGLEITGVRMTKDLQIARVYFHLRESDEGKQKRAKKGLESASGFLKRAIAQDLELRVMPNLQFHYDESIDLEEKIERLMAHERVE